MRIISDKRDYYDCIQAHGQDRTLVYIRKPEIITFKRKKYGDDFRVKDTFPFSTPWYWKPSYVAKVYFIGFCGRVYPVLKVECGAYDRVPRQPNEVNDFCYSIDEVDKFFAKHLKSRQFKVWNGDATRGDKRHWTTRWSQLHRPDFVKFFKEFNRDAYGEMFQVKRCPIFVAQAGGSPKITYNALLSPFDFVRIVDPFTAFQEISIFMGSMAMPEKVMPIIPDELKIHSRGFTDQSFRAPFRDAKRVPK